MSEEHKFALLHDLVSSPISHHCVWSVITGHNLTPEKRDTLTYTLTRSSIAVSRVSAQWLNCKFGTQELWKNLGSYCKLKGPLSPCWYL